MKTDSQKNKDYATDDKPERFLGMTNGQLAFLVVFVVWLIFAGSIVDLNTLTNFGK